MARVRALATASVATAAVGATLFSTATPAGADPAVYRAFAGVGSDTTQSILNAAAGDAAGSNGVLNGYVASYDAFGSPTIQTKSGGPQFTRPAGSGQGRQALYASVTNSTFKGTDVTGQVDFARSSAFLASGATGTSADGRVADYVPFARDGVSYAYKGATASTVGKLTTAQLTAIYSASGPVTVNGIAITGYLPPASSGTRTFFLSAIGVTTVGSGVQSLAQENDGTLLPAGATKTANIVPFSAAQWVGQTNKVQPDLRGGAALGAPNAKTAITVSSAGVAAPVATYFNSAPFGRSVYNVLDDATAPTALRDLFINKTVTKSDGSTTTVAAPLCSTAGLALSKKYGFAAITTSTTGQTCGVAIQGGFPTPAP